MKAVVPRIVGLQVRVAENQPEYTPVDTIRARHPDYQNSPKGYNSVIMAFEPSPEERQRLINGEDIYIALLTFGFPQQPIMLSVGPEDMARWHETEVVHKPTPYLRLEKQDDVPCGDATGIPTDAEGPE